LISIIVCAPGERRLASSARAVTRGEQAWETPMPTSAQPRRGAEDGASVGADRSPWAFFLLTFVLAVPFLVVGAASGAQLMPGLPIAGLMFICPGAAAVVLAWRAGGGAGAAALLRRVLDARRIGALWYAPILLLKPAIALACYGVLRLTASAAPAPQIALVPTLALCAVFLVAAIGEELGWTGYATDPLQARWGPLRAGLILGAVWAAFHFIALGQAHRSVGWIAGWALGTVATRVIMVWLFNHTGRSVFAAALFHMTINVCWQSFPVRGSYFDPRLDGLFTALVAVVIVAVWRPGMAAPIRSAAPPEG
jgi:membrane protease YdiL (CAAX protease family)